MPDLVVLAGFVGAAYAIDGDFLTTGDYPRGEWGEWLGHAYRVRLVQEYGLTTWDHAWTGGISPFQTYQFVPHVVTAVVAQLGSASIGRTMLLLEALLIFWVRSTGYVSARLLGVSRPASLTAGFVTFGIFDYRAEILSFTTLWGLALVPLLLVAVWRYRDLPKIYLVAAAVGLSVYVHPHAALAGVVALIAVFLSGPVTWVGFRRLALQGLLVGLATGFYWMPAVFSAKPTMQDPASADVVFLRTVFEGNVERVNDLAWVIAPLIALTLFLFRRTVHRRLLLYIATFAASTLFLIAVSYAGVGPESVRLIQGIRLINLLPLSLGLLGAFAVDAALRGAKQYDARGVLASICAVVVAVGLFLPVVRFAADRDYEPVAYGSDPLAAWFEEHEYGQPGRVWLSGSQTSWYTVRHFGEIRSTRSAFVQGDWSLLARPLQEGILVGDPDWETTEDYLRAMAVSHLVVSDNLAAGRALGPGDGLALGYEEVLRFETFPPASLYRTPWEPVDAFFGSAENLSLRDFPGTKYASKQDRALRDRLIGEYVQVAYSADATPVDVEYPSATRMLVRLRDLPSDQYLVIAENWDRAWKATADGKGLPVQRYGPNYIRVDVSELKGNVTVELHHEMSFDWKLGIGLTLLSIPAGVGLMLWERRR